MTETKFDFTSIIDRHDKDALAIDALGKEEFKNFAPSKPKEGFDIIPMWVADMNFAVPPSITDAIKNRLNHPLFGYFLPKKDYFNSIINWQEKRNGVKELKEENIGYENGVLGGVISACNILCSRGDKILVHSPTYIGFTMCLENNGYKIIHSKLIQDENLKWKMNYEEMEEKIKNEKIHCAIICNPHNPCGRVWTKEELLKAFEIFEKYDVQVISDEIWSDIILFDNKHIPTQSISEYAKNNTIAFYAPTKTFNLAGLIGSYHIIYNKRLRDRILKESSLSHYNSMNILSMYALIGAYNNIGEEWVDELKKVLSKNVDFVVNFINEKFKGVKVFKPEGTYMLFVDCEEWCKENNKSLDDVLKCCWDVGAIIQSGKAFHGEWCIRVNVASPFERIKEGFERMDKYVFNKK